MARAARHELSPFKRRPLTIPPNSLHSWIRLAVWEIWMGGLLCVILGFGIGFIITSPAKIVVFTDLANCYAPPPVPMPCEHVTYRGGLLNAAFTALCGFMLMVVAVWLMWELWNAAEPRPITDDFLKLLNDSFGRSWRNPFTWPWARVLWAYGFAAVGGILAAGVGVIIWTLVIASDAPVGRIDTSQSFSLGR